MNEPEKEAIAREAALLWLERHGFEFEPPIAAGMPGPNGLGIWKSEIRGKKCWIQETWIAKLSKEKTPSQVVGALESSRRTWETEQGIRSDADEKTAAKRAIDEEG